VHPCETRIEQALRADSDISTKVCGSSHDHQHESFRACSAIDSCSSCLSRAFNALVASVPPASVVISRRVLVAGFKARFRYFRQLLAHSMHRREIRFMLRLPFSFHTRTASVRDSQQRHLTMVKRSYTSTTTPILNVGLWLVDACTIGLYMPLTGTEG
jgi:hypothetical protein